ncbi:hypothetical protein J6590_102956, partial [Homalodisca vitripennis]
NKDEANTKRLNWCACCLDVPVTVSAKVLCSRVRGADVDGDDSEATRVEPKGNEKGVGDEGEGEGVGTLRYQSRRFHVL